MAALTKKDYYYSDNICFSRLDYWNILPCFIILKEEHPADNYKGWSIHIGIFCFAINFIW